MSFRAQLEFEGEVFDIIKTSYTARRDRDTKGRPSSNIYGARIFITVESTDKVSLFDKMANQFRPNSGTISFKKDDEDSTMKELKWENGYIVRLSETMNRVNNTPMLIDIEVSAQILSIGDAILEQNWPEMV